MSGDARLESMRPIPTYAIPILWIGHSLPCPMPPQPPLPCRSWEPFDPHPLLEARPEIGEAYRDALASCRRVRWSEADGVGFFLDRSADLEEGWTWDETLALSFHLHESVFIVDFQVRGNAVRAYRIERAVPLSIQIMDH